MRHNIEINPTLVHVFGTLDCADTKGSRTQLAALHVSYQYHDLENPGEVADLESILGPGPHKKPTILFLHNLDKTAQQIIGEPLYEPKAAELATALTDAGILS